MNPQHFSVQLGCLLAIASAVTVLTQSPSQAQDGNFSDVTGPVMGGEIAPPPIIPAENITPPPVVAEPPPPAPEPAPVEVTPAPEPAPVEVTPAPEPAPVEVTPAPEPAPVEVTPAPETFPVEVTPAPETFPVEVTPVDPVPVQVPTEDPFPGEPALPVTTDIPSGPSEPRSSETTPSSDLEGQQGVISTTGDLGGEFGSGSGTQTIFAGTGNAQASVNEAGTIVLSQLNVGNITATTGASISVEAQQLVAVVLTSGDVNSVNALTTALSNTPGSPSVEATRRLASKLARLLADGQVNAEQLLDAIGSYNEMIMQSNAEFLGNPPAELLAIQISLSRLIEAAGGS